MIGGGTRVISPFFNRHGTIPREEQKQTKKWRECVFADEDEVGDEISIQTKRDVGECPIRGVKWKRICDYNVFGCLGSCCCRKEGEEKEALHMRNEMMTKNRKEGGMSLRTPQSSAPQHSHPMRHRGEETRRNEEKLAYVEELSFTSFSSPCLASQLDVWEEMRRKINFISG